MPQENPFADLIPQAATAPPATANAFADLIPRRKPDRATAAGDSPFADLVPEKPGFLSSLGTFAKEAIPQVAGGVMDALEQAADLGESILPLGTFDIQGGRVVHRAVEPEKERGFPEVAPPETLAGGLVRGVSQFLTGFLPANRALGALGVAAKAGKGAQALGLGAKGARVAGVLTQAEVAAQIASQTVFNPNEERLSNLIEEFPSLRNPVTAYLAADPNDTEVRARFKIALEGLGLGAMTAGFIEAVRALRTARQARKAQTPPGAAAEGAEPLAPAAPETPPVPPAGPVPALSAKARALLERLNPSRRRTLEDVGRAREAEAGALAGADPDLDNLLDVLRGKGKPPRRPRTLTQFLKDEGGLREYQGELAAIGITSKTRPGLINNATGRPLDEAGLRAFEEGFFPERPTIAELLDALGEDFAGRAVRIHPQDTAEAEFFDLLGEVDEVLTRAGANLDDMSNAEVRVLLQGLAEDRVPRGLADLEREAAEQARAAAGGPETLDVGPPGARAGNINLGRIQSGQDAKRVLSETADIIAPEIDAARRGTIRQEEVSRLATDLRMTEAELLKRQRGGAFNAEQAVAARRLLITSANALVKAARAAQGGNDEALGAFQEAFTRHVAVQEQIAGLTAEAGRALGAFRIAAKGKTARARALKQIIESGGGREKIEDLAARIAALEDDEQLAAFTRSVFKPKFREKVFEIWINALLSGPRTHAVNVTSNALTTLWTLPEHLLAATFGTVRRGPDKVRFREVGSKLYGLVEGVKDGLRYMAKALRTGESQFDPIGKIETVRRRSVRGPLGEIVRLPGRFLQAEDDFFKATAYRMELRTLAARDGLRSGLHGERLAEHIEKIVALPAEALHLKALDTARKLTFTKPLGAIGQNITNAANMIPGGRVILPFIRTPSNLIKFAAERSPLGFAMREVRDAMKKGGAERDLALARMALGTSVAVAVAAQAAEGHITGAGPTHPGQRALLRANGWQPYSIKIGNTYYSYNRLDPFGLTLGVAADFAEIAGHMTKDEGERLGALIVGSLSKNLVNKTWLRGLSELVEAVNDPDRYGDRYIQSLAGTIIPTGVAQVAQSQDPVLRSTRPGPIEDPLLREAEAIMNKIKSRLPGYSKDLPPVRNLFGEPVILSGGLGPDLISPVFTSVDRDDPAIDEMLRLKVTPSMPSRTIKGVKLTPQKYDEYVQLAGRPAKDLLDVLVASPKYAALPSLAKAKAIRDIIASTREAATKAILVANPGLVKGIARRRLERVTGP